MSKDNSFESSIIECLENINKSILSVNSNLEVIASDGLKINNPMTSMLENMSENISSNGMNDSLSENTQSVLDMLGSSAGEGSDLSGFLSSLKDVRARLSTINEAIESSKNEEASD